MIFEQKSQKEMPNWLISNVLNKQKKNILSIMIWIFHKTLNLHVVWQYTQLDSKLCDQIKKKQLYAKFHATCSLKLHKVLNWVRLDDNQTCLEYHPYQSYF